MPRRVNLPAADDLFRPTDPESAAAKAGSKRSVRAVPDPAPQDRAQSLTKKPSGRIKHDEKVTVYVTSQELVEIEHARLALRGTHGLAVDRGRLLREAISLVLADLEENGEQSAIVQRLSE